MERPATPADLDGPSQCTSASPPQAELRQMNGDGHGAAPHMENSTPSCKDLTIQTESAAPTGECSESEDGDPQSVILAPSTFGQFDTDSSVRGTSTESVSDKSNVSNVSNVTIIPSATTPVASKFPDKKTTTSPVSPHALTTSLSSPPTNWTDDATPRAQTRHEVEQLNGRRRRDSLEDILESIDGDAPNEAQGDSSESADMAGATVPNADDELKALRAALSECWTLCNTLAALSWNHRERLFRYRGRNDKLEHAWKTCWKLCQTLYDNRDSGFHHVKPILDLCRQFCQALFEIRVRDNEVADSVLRVSFELNNHLYNTHDRNLPEAFRERTLDFYITLCHRLMKQRASLAEEADSLLRACWTLAEMLFNLRQSKREGKAVDEDLLGSAVQACWELCDLFREGWTQIRPDRRLPTASQTAFTQAFYQARQRRESTLGEDLAAGLGNPETPTTIFEDTATVAPDQAPVPNIIVLGSGDSNSPPGPRQWSSASSSTLSSYSSKSSAQTIRSQAEDPNLTCLKLLIVRAAMNSGFERNGSQPLPFFVKSLSSDSFGTLSWQMSLLMNYRKLVMGDPAFRILPPASRVRATDVARAVRLMVQHSSQYSWLLDLFRWVLGFRAEEAIHRSEVVLQA